MPRPNSYPNARPRHVRFALEAEISRLLRQRVLDYLERVGPYGAERSWLTGQVAALGHSPQRVSAMLALLTAEGLVQVTRGDDGEAVRLSPMLEQRRLAA